MIFQDLRESYKIARTNGVSEGLEHLGLSFLRRHPRLRDTVVAGIVGFYGGRTAEDKVPEPKYATLDPRLEPITPDSIEFDPTVTMVDMCHGYVGDMARRHKLAAVVITTNNPEALDAALYERLRTAFDGTACLEDMER
jgi:hypothetical protein